jgi:hypothetical protein
MNPTDGQERSRAVTIPAIQNNGILFNLLSFIGRHLSIIRRNFVQGLSFGKIEATCMPPHQPIGFLCNFIKPGHDADGLRKSCAVSAENSRKGAQN